MANFSPRIEEASEAELYNWIQNSDPQYGSLASDELTRRQSKQLEQSNAKLQIVILGLTAIMAFVALLPVFQSLSILFIPVNFSSLVSVLFSAVLATLWIFYLRGGLSFQRTTIQLTSAFGFGMILFLIYFFWFKHLF